MNAKLEVSGNKVVKITFLTTVLSETIEDICIPEMEMGDGDDEIFKFRDSLAFEFPGHHITKEVEYKPTAEFLVDLSKN